MEQKKVKIYDLKSKKVTEHVIEIQTSRHPENHNALFILKLNIEGKELLSKQEYFLINALEQIQTQLEELGKLIIVRGADANVGMSGMQADMTNGCSITKNEFNEKVSEDGPPFIDLGKFIFHVLDESRIENIYSITGLDIKYKTELGNMKTIWKTELKVESYQEIELPKDSKILTARTVNNKGFLWFQFEVGNEKKTEIRKFITITTGDKFERNGEFIGTLFYNEGKIVQHLYEI